MNIDLEPFGLAHMPLPDIAGTYRGELLIVGSGRCVWDDLSRWTLDCDVMAVNDVGMHLPKRLRHWYSNDVRMLSRWSEARRPLLVDRLGTGWALHSCNPGVRWEWPWPGHGSSGLNAVYTGLALGYDSIVLAGIPLDDEGHYFDPPWVKTNFTKEAGERIWLNAKRMFRGKVRSLSGRSREYFGAPD